MTFRDDLALASEFVATYLETVGERPVLPPVARAMYRPRTGTGSVPVAASACSIAARVS